ncbi:zinc finger protein OZF [Anastrepha ludens]|uniref:zinc finger protein OZF n=1 Tax=Anastrepha ludens TaxID=28586 RepID=UPI0023AEFD11|nr:zinc finger protein OZF [Anastrepha ludens]
MSITNISNAHCPRCGVLVTETANRLVTDSCGHRKCRRCLLTDDECMECLQQMQCDIKNKTIQIIDSNTVAECKVAPEVNIGVVAKNFTKKGRKVASMPTHICRVANDSDAGMHYYCTRCCRKFTSRSQQYYHLTCGSDASKKYKCQHCDKAFATSSHFNYHMETHAERTYCCKQCNKSFTNRMVLRKHERLHYMTPMQCSECGKEFRSKDSLSAHIRKMHDDKDLPYKCEQCQKSYALKSTLKQHMQKHFDKKYWCKYCDKQFQRNYTLKIHLKKHTKTDCFICGICLNKFSDSAVLLRHVKLHQDTIKYRCIECDVTIMRKDNMLRHIRTLHPDRNFENCVEITKPILSDAHKEIEVEDPLVDKPPVTEPKTVENSAVIKCIGNVAPMKVPTCQVSIIPTSELDTNSAQTDVNTNTISNISTFTPLRNVPLNIHSTASGGPKVVQKRVKKKYDPIKMYRKILNSDCKDESVNESESEKEEMYNIQPQCATNSVSGVDMTPVLEKRVTLSTSNFSEMHWRKNFKYTYEYQDF